MAKIPTQFIQSAAKNASSKVDVKAIRKTAIKAGENLTDQAAKVKEAAIDTKEDIEKKLTELDHVLEASITEYNDAFTLMNDKGIQLYVERNRASDVIENVEVLVNSIANHPKDFDVDFEQIRTSRRYFKDGCEFAERELQAARNAAGGAGAGLAAGASVAFMGPTAAMWIATTFGTASTGAAISTLSGAAASNAALAWLGGGALAAGGEGIAGGTALLALAGPVGWTIAGATLLSSILLFAKKRTKLNKEKNEEITAVKKNTEKVKEMDVSLAKLLRETREIKAGLMTSYTGNLSAFGADYQVLDAEQKSRLGAMVNAAKALSALFEKTVQ